MVFNMQYTTRGYLLEYIICTVGHLRGKMIKNIILRKIMRAFIAAPLISCLGPSAWHLDLALRKTVAALSVGRRRALRSPITDEAMVDPVIADCCECFKKKKKKEKDGGGQT